MKKLIIGGTDPIDVTVEDILSVGGTVFTVQDLEELGINVPVLETQIHTDSIFKGNSSFKTLRAAGIKWNLWQIPVFKLEGGKKLLWVAIIKRSKIRVAYSAIVI